MSRSPTRILHAFHGYLGAPADFHFLAEALGVDFAVADPSDVQPLPWEIGDLRHDSPSGLVAWDIEGFFRAGLVDGWSDWSTAFARAASRLFPDPATHHSLLGYSLGGRLALHLVADCAARLGDSPLPQAAGDPARTARLERNVSPSSTAHADAPLLRWQRAIIVSAHPGLVREDDRAQRRINDGVWAQRFREQSWLETIRAWNAQPALSSSLNLPPSRTHEDVEPTPQRRARLAEMMIKLSLGNQVDLRPGIAAFVERTGPHSLLLMAGAADTKFVAVLRELAEQVPTAALWVCEEAGHRLPWDQPEKFAAYVGEFLLREAKGTG